MHTRLLQHLRPMAFFNESVIPESLYYVSAFHTLEGDGLKGLIDVLRREIKGQKSWSRSQFTRAQAIKAMTADAVTQPPKLEFISPELDVVQTIQAA